MAQNKLKIGWIGMGRMGFSMAERLLKAGHDVSIWNRTRSKAEPLAKLGGKIVDKPTDLAGVDVLFSIVSTGKDLKQVYFEHERRADREGQGAADPGRLLDHRGRGLRRHPQALDRSRRELHRLPGQRQRQGDQGRQAVGGRLRPGGRLSRTVEPLIQVFAPRGVSYVGDGELARVCKIAHNVMLGVVIENLIEITLLANKMGVPRHAFLAFMNNSVMGSMFTAYKSPALVNLDWTTTFTPELLRKDLDLGLELGREYDVPMPVTAATREVVQTHFGAATLQKNPEDYLAKDFAALAETMALMSGMKLESENKNVPTGLES